MVQDYVGTKAKVIIRRPTNDYSGKIRRSLILHISYKMFGFRNHNGLLAIKKDFPVLFIMIIS